MPILIFYELFDMLYPTDALGDMVKEGATTAIEAWGKDKNGTPVFAAWDKDKNGTPAFSTLVCVTVYRF